MMAARLVGQSVEQTLANVRIETRLQLCPKPSPTSITSDCTSATNFTEQPILCTFFLLFPGRESARQCSSFAGTSKGTYLPVLSFLYS